MTYSRHPPYLLALDTCYGHLDTLLALDFISLTCYRMWALTRATGKRLLPILK